MAVVTQLSIGLNTPANVVTNVALHSIDPYDLPGVTRAYGEDYRQVERIIFFAATTLLWLWLQRWFAHLFRHRLLAPDIVWATSAIIFAVGIAFAVGSGIRTLRIGEPLAIVRGFERVSSQIGLHKTLVFTLVIWQGLSLLWAFFLIGSGLWAAGRQFVEGRKRHEFVSAAGAIFIVLLLACLWQAATTNAHLDWGDGQKTIDVDARSWSLCALLCLVGSGICFRWSFQARRKFEGAEG